MIGNLALHVFGLYAALTLVSCHVFFHEPITIPIPEPTGGARLHTPSEFGFSMEFWNKSLIISSPKSLTATNKNFGEMYSCPLTKISDNKTECNVLALDTNSSSYTLDINENQIFYLGGSMAATKDFILICAPLVTKNMSKPGENSVRLDIVGTCFILDTYGNTTTIQDSGNRYLDGLDESVGRFSGGTGWSARADEGNGYLIIAKPTFQGDIVYLPTSNLAKHVKSLFTTILDTSKYKEKNAAVFHDSSDIGLGMAFGCFFEKNETVYAFSMQSEDMIGMILFFRVKKTMRKRGGKKEFTTDLEMIKDEGKYHYYMSSLENQLVGAMFGYALEAADLTLDGLSELLVGAPLESEDPKTTEVEYGAVHIFLGGIISMPIDKKERLVIYGAKQRGRFGMTIAVCDIDGDSIPEIFVSAPYEDLGVVYILSGFELKKELLHSEKSLKIKTVSDFMHMQKVTAEYLKPLTQTQLGFSLKVVPDMDENGCNELAIGAPGVDSVLLLRCMQTLNVTVTSKLVESNVWVEDKNFNVNVCINVRFMSASNISGSILVKNNIIINEGNNATIKSGGKFDVDLSKKEGTSLDQCELVVVDLEPDEKGSYLLTSNAELNENTFVYSKDNYKSWVKLSTYEGYSKLQSETTIWRRCRSDVDCTPQLTYSINRATRPESATSDERKYEIESTKNESVVIVVKNVGNVIVWSGPCVVVEVTGAPVSSVNCDIKSVGHMECMVKTPFRTNQENNFEIVLNMTKISNVHNELSVRAQLHEKCEQKNDDKKNRSLFVAYDFIPAWKRIILKGNQHDLFITDKELTPEELQKKSSFRGDQEYWIINNGIVTWNNIGAVIVIEKRTFIAKVGTSESNCAVSEENNHHTIKCALTLLPGTTKKIIIWATLTGKEIGDPLNEGQNINITSQMKLFMNVDFAPESETVSKDLVTVIKLKKDISLENKLWLIALVAVIIALILLALVTWILYKKGYFNRDKKKKLDVLRETVRRRSIRLTSEKSHRSNATPSTADGDDHIDIEVVDDSPFEEVPINNKDDAILIESQAEVHGHDQDKKVD